MKSRWALSTSSLVILAIVITLTVFGLATSTLAQNVGKFTPTGSMQTARDDLLATRLPNGQVLVIGGSTTAAELYDPAARTFSATGSMQAPHDFGTATLLSSGKVLVRGGDGVALATPAELYDPSTGTFSDTGTTTQEFNSSHSTATLLPGGKVLIIGGDTQIGPAGDELYDPATGTFSALDSNISLRIYNQTATLLNNGKVLIAGGDNFFNGTGFTLSTSELYDPSANTFSASIPMITGREAHTATLLSNGEVLLTGGYFHNCCGLPNGPGYGTQGVHGSTELFDPSTNTFSRGADLNGAVYSQTATLLPNGQVLIAGGADIMFSPDGSQTGTTGETLAELYDPSTGAFSNTGSLNTGRSQHGAASLNDGTVLVAGGIDASSNALASAEIYTAAQSTPAVIITSPSNGATVSGTVTISATVLSSVQWINFYVDGNYLTSSPPFSASWNSTSVPDGTHIISVNAYNSSGQVGSASVTVSVANNASSGVVKITSPSTGATVSGTVAINLTVGAAVQWVDLYIDGTYLESSPPYNFSWDSTSIANGTHVISVKAFSSGGLIGSDSVTVTVANGAGAGAVTITSPTQGSTVSGNVRIAASVTSAVSWIDVYIDGVYFASSPPLTFMWNSKSVANGGHSISVTGFGSSGTAVAATHVNVNVAN